MIYVLFSWRHRGRLWLARLRRAAMPGAAGAAALTGYKAGGPGGWQQFPVYLGAGLAATVFYTLIVFIALTVAAPFIPAAAPLLPRRLVPHRRSVKEVP